MARGWQQRLHELGWAMRGAVTQPRLMWEMWQLERSLPARMQETPVDELLAQLTSPTRDLSLPADTVREVADAVAVLDRGSPLGLCLRRSLVRYNFLRRAGVPVAIQLGARFAATRDIAGHAWLTLDGSPYHEESENYQGFVVMYSYPAAVN